MTPALTGTRAAARTGRPAAATGAARRASVTTKPRAFRRVSGAAAPARRETAPNPARPGLRPLPVLGTIGSHALRAGKENGSSLLDRLLRGRGWIGLLGVLLIGLVALNVGLLKVNAQAGRNAAAARETRTSNAELRGKVARLSSAERLERAAAREGMVKAPAGAIRYMKSHPGSDGKLAAKRITEGALAPVVAEAPVDPTVSEDPTAVATDPTVAPDTAVDPVTTETAPTDTTADTGGGTEPTTETGVPGTG